MMVNELCRSHQRSLRRELAVIRREQLKLAIRKKELEIFTLQQKIEADKEYHLRLEIQATQDNTSAVTRVLVEDQSHNQETEVPMKENIRVDENVVNSE